MKYQDPHRHPHRNLILQTQLPFIQLTCYLSLLLFLFFILTVIKFLVSQKRFSVTRNTWSWLFKSHPSTPSLFYPLTIRHGICLLNSISLQRTTIIEPGRVYTYQSLYRQTSYLTCLAQAIFLRLSTSCRQLLRSRL